MKARRRKFAHIPIPPAPPEADAQFRVTHSGDYSAESYKDRVARGRAAMTADRARRRRNVTFHAPFDPPTFTDSQWSFRRDGAFHVARCDRCGGEETALTRAQLIVWLCIHEDKLCKVTA